MEITFLMLDGKEQVRMRLDGLSNFQIELGIFVKAFWPEVPCSIEQGLVLFHAYLVAEDGQDVDMTLRPVQNGCVSLPEILRPAGSTRGGVIGKIVQINLAGANNNAIQVRKSLEGLAKHGAKQFLSLGTPDIDPVLFVADFGVELLHQSFRQH